MRHVVLAALLVTSTAAGAVAQADTPLSPLAHSIACAPPPTYEPAPAKVLRIAGSQDPTPRSLFGDRDLLVIGGGTAAGVELGQQFFIRRTITYGTSKAPRGA